METKMEDSWARVRPRADVHCDVICVWLFAGCGAVSCCDVLLKNIFFGRYLGILVCGNF